MDGCPSCGKSSAIPGVYCRHRGAKTEALSAIGPSEAAWKATGKASALWKRRSKLGKACTIIGGFILVGVMVGCSPTDRPAPATTTKQDPAPTEYKQEVGAAFDEFRSAAPILPPPPSSSQPDPAAAAGSGVRWGENFRLEGGTGRL